MNPAELSSRNLALSMLWRVPPRVLRRMIAHLDAGHISHPWRARDLDIFESSLPPAARRGLLQHPSREELEKSRRVMRELDIELLVRGTPPFPRGLGVIPDPPPFLFTRGAPLAGGEAPRVAVVGSRAASSAGREIAYGLGRDLALAGVEVVSGMARGIDSEAHRGALDAGGRTIAVLGTGADVCYPPEHHGLLQRILRQGGVVTEFPPGIAGMRLHFPRRNRILTGLAQVLVVVEGAERSGARSSVDHACDQGREVMAVPRDIVHPGSALPNRLIRDGAKPVLSVLDILESLPGGALAGGSAEAAGIGRFPPAGTLAPALPAGPPLDPLERRLLEGLRRRKCDLEGCLRLAPGTETGTMQAALSRLEVMGWIVRGPGGRFAAASAR